MLGLTEYLYPATVLFHNAINRGEAEAGTLARFLGSEERFENAGQNFGGNTAAGIAHTQPDVSTGNCLRMKTRKSLIDALFCRFDEQAATLRHRVPRIDDQIEEHLFEHSGIGVYN